MEKNYDPKAFEDRIYKEWEEGGHFIARIDENKKPFTILMPPPNVTGVLHIGHALNNTLQDILIRWKRMEGYSALWIPGTDHASISTEMKVVEKIESEGKTKKEMGREAFLEEAWEWTRKYGGNIMKQLRKLGVSCDWSRTRFTLDEMLSNAVLEVFIKFYNKGLIYRGDRIINWCPSCKTALSDAEVEHEDSHGKIWRFFYPLKDGNGGIEIETTRPETILGDLAVAVNPEDEKYKDLVGKTLLLPVVGREIPIIADSYVEMGFGSGAVKITPSHDPNDFEVGERHNLGQCIVINGDGTIAEGYGDYSGLDRFEARKKIIEDFDKLGYFKGAKDHENAIGHCERCGTIIEPLISKQWFVKMKDLADRALKVYYDGEVNFYPPRLGKVYENWMVNIRDWCISRQLWWGHRIPVYYCDCGEIIVSKETPKSCPKCGSSSLKQDEDTLDTWFSSALWAFSTLGWPEETEDLKYFYPTDVLVTGYDIIFFWVARMIFSSLQQTDQVPFKDVLFNGIVRDAQGRKMSKSLGNGIDPLDIIENYGADALRFTLSTGNTPGNDMRFSTEKVEASRNFANKLWNASRFVMMHLDESVTESLNESKLREEDKWILSKLNTTVKEATDNLNKYELGMAADKVYDFTWNDFCDWYIEMVKPRLFSEDESDKSVAKSVLLRVLSNILKLIHPFMPFITEEIWTFLPNKASMLIDSSFPLYEDLGYKEAEDNIEYVKEAIRAIRNIRAEMNIPPSKKATEIFVTKDEEISKILKENELHFKNLSSADNIEVRDSNDGLGENYVQIVLEKANVFIPLSELIDFEKELERLDKERTNLISEIKRAEGKLSNKGFTDKAPEKVVNEEREKLEKYKGMLNEVEERIGSLKKED